MSLSTAASPITYGLRSMPNTALYKLEESLKGENSQGCRDKDNYANVTIDVEKGDIDLA